MVDGRRRSSPRAVTAARRRHRADDFAGVLAAARAGDERAWTQLIGDLAPALVGYVRLRGAAEPEDVAGEVLLRVARTIHRFEGDAAQFRSWVFTIAHRQLIDQYRRAARSATLVTFDEDAAESSLPARAEVDDILDLQWSAEGTARLLDRLSPDQRDVVLLRLIGGFSLAEVAEIVGKDVNAVKQLQHRGVNALRRLLTAAAAAAAAVDADAVPAAPSEARRR